MTGDISYRKTDRASTITMTNSVLISEKIDILIVLQGISFDAEARQFFAEKKVKKREKEIFF